MVWTCQGCGRNYDEVKDMIDTQKHFRGTPVIPSELATNNCEDKVGWRCLACDKFHRCEYLERYVSNETE